MNKPVPVFKFRQGSAPLLVSMPHVGTHIPSSIDVGMNDAARKLADTDWHLEELYDFLGELGASILIATHSRYVVDLNRPPDNANLYPGQDTTGLCPLDTFDRQPLYQAGKEPGASEILARVEQYWQPYHTALDSELQRLRAQHGVALLWDAHSIASVVPRFFAGRLPDFNLGTASGNSCADEMSQALSAIANSSSDYSNALNGRFKGGYITRHYGKPDNNIHAVQLELSQITYMEESYPFKFNDKAAQQVRPTISRMLESMLEWAEKHH
ncbi:MAG: N-formylglutamate deformylase [Burkholderiaceae bacterium]|nr:N-formylglutamate deformylase [Burkholderiaceae bacterium]